MRKSTNLTESQPSPFESHDNSFDHSEVISTRSETKSWSSLSVFFEKDVTESDFRRRVPAVSLPFLRRSHSHRRLTSPMNERGPRDRWKKGSLLGIPVFEVKEEQEKEASRVLSKIKILRDDEEFGFNNHYLYRKAGVPRRGKSLDPLKLPKVEEAALLEEDVCKPLFAGTLNKLDIFKDKNEFGVSSSKKLGSFIEKTPFLECSEELPIEEELEKERKNEGFATNLLWSNVSSNSNSSYNSPRFKLKVDELDERREFLEKKKKFEQENEIIEEEEKQELHENPVSLYMRNSRKSMEEEKFFMKKIIKGEIIEEKDLIALTLQKGFVDKAVDLQPLVESEYEILSRSDSDSEKEGMKKAGFFEDIQFLRQAFD